MKTTKTIVTCDRCGKEWVATRLNEPMGHFKIELGSSHLGLCAYNVGYSRYDLADLCDECKDSLEEWFCRG